MEIRVSVGLVLVAAALMSGQQQNYPNHYLTIDIGPDGKGVGIREETAAGVIFRMSRDFTAAIPMWTVPKVSCFAFGQGVVFTLDEAGQFRIHEIETGVVQKAVHLGIRVFSCAINSTGTMAAVAGFGSGTRISFVDIATLRTLRESERFSTTVYTMRFSPDGRWLASGEFNRIARLWDVRTGIEQDVFRGHFAWVASLGFSDNSRCLITSSYGGFRLWDLATGQLKKTSSTPEAFYEPLPFAYAKDGRVLFPSPSRQNTIQSLLMSCSEPPAEPSALRVLTIGISEYADPRNNLPAARNDAAAVGSSLVVRAKGAYRQVAPIRLYDRSATLSGIEAAFARLAAESHADDVVVVYFAGHGVDKDGQFYLLPSDASLDSPSKLGLSTAEIARLISRVSARRKLLIVDACQSGGALSKLSAAIQKQSGVSLFLIASSLESALEIRRLGHGILTYSLLDALGSKNLTALGLIQIVNKAVPALSGRYFPARAQQVTAVSKGRDFLLTGVK